MTTLSQDELVKQYNIIGDQFDALPDDADDDLYGQVTDQLEAAWSQLDQEHQCHVDAFGQVAMYDDDDADAEGVPTVKLLASSWVDSPEVPGQVTFTLRLAVVTEDGTTKETEVVTVKKWEFFDVLLPWLYTRWAKKFGFDARPQEVSVYEAHCAKYGHVAHLTEEAYNAARGRAVVLKTA